VNELAASQDKKQQLLKKGKSFEMDGKLKNILNDEESENENDYNHIKEYISSIDESMKVEY
jgi:hypothetical protein